MTYNIGYMKNPRPRQISRPGGGPPPPPPKKKKTIFPIRIRLLNLFLCDICFTQSRYSGKCLNFENESLLCNDRWIPIRYSNRSVD
jgi:hypothetical protein